MKKKPNVTNRIIWFTAAYALSWNHVLVPPQLHFITGNRLGLVYVGWDPNYANYGPCLKSQC